MRDKRREHWRRINEKLHGVGGAAQPRAEGSGDRGSGEVSMFEDRNVASVQCVRGLASFRSD